MEHPLAGVGHVSATRLPHFARRPCVKLGQMAHMSLIPRLTIRQLKGLATSFAMSHKFFEEGKGCRPLL